MSKNALAFLVLSVALASGAAYLNWLYLNVAGTEADPSGLSPEVVDVVVARTELTQSAEVEGPRLKVVEWPARLVPEGAFERISDVAGRIPLRRFSPGEVLLESGLYGEGVPGGLPALIGNGLRAMSVNVDDVIGIAGFVRVGTAVDVVATFRRGVDTDAFSQVVLQDVKVLAVGTELEPQNAEPGSAASVVTLEVTPGQAKRLAFAASQGSIQLALRSRGDTGIANGSSVGTPDLRGDAVVRPSSKNSIGIMRGTASSSENFLSSHVPDPPATRSDDRPDSYAYAGERGGPAVLARSPRE